MGKASSKVVKAFEGKSTFVSERNPANLQQAIDAALGAARKAGHKPGDRFDVEIWVELREHNQNVKVYGATATSRPKT
jgi:hypothetical protein